MKTKLRIFIWINVFAIYILTMHLCYTYKQEIIDYLSRQKIIVQEKVIEPETVTKYITIEREVDTSKYIELLLDVNNVEQNPELPTGCEVTALTTTLNYFDYNIDKLTLSDLFLPKGEIGKTHPDEAFIGNPRSQHSYGAYAPVIVKTANDYLNKAESQYQAYNISGGDFSTLIKYLYDGYPVIIWATMNMQPSYLTTKWNLNGKEFQWIAREHCLVLVGFTKDEYIIADPLKKGLTYYNKDLVETRYNELGKQAVVIY